MGMIGDLNWRYATKVFSDRKIEQADLDELLEVLRLSPSSFGLQPWKFIVIEDKELREKLVEHSYGQRQVADASHLIVLTVKKNIDTDYIKKFVRFMAETRGVSAESLKDYEDVMISSITKKSREEVQEWARRQVYIALGMLHFAAATKRIDSCPMEGFDKDAYDRILGLEDHTSVVLCPVGYRGEDKYATRKKVRFPRDEVFIFK